ncbi:MAG: DUF2971 domain-containing protein [Treponema sp.]|nr:DUF2971 domain-containing protein [Treponema sp.]
MSNLIYHYTSLNALYEIIKTKSLLLPTLHGMNDPLEGGYKPDVFISDLDFDKYPQKVNENTKQFFKLLSTLLKNNKKQFIKNCKNKTEPYSLSFSMKEDNISHWERYGNNMKGVCIAFDLDEMELLNPPLGYEIYLRKIIYKDEDRRKYIRASIVNLYNEINKSIDEKKQENFIEIIKKNCVPNLAGIYLSVHYFIKNEYWNEEDEIRLLYDEQSWKDTLNLLKKIVLNGGKDLIEAYNQNHLSLGLDKTEYHCFSTIRPCKRLSLKQVWSEDLIPKIIIGSKSSQNLKDLKLFLKANDLGKTKITESRIKIR